MLSKITTALLLCFWMTGANAAETLTTPQTHFTIRAVHSLDDQHTSYDFGIIPLNVLRTADFTLTNTGTEVLYVQDISIEGFDFSAYHNCPDQMTANQQCTIQAQVLAQMEGLLTGRISISTNGGQILIDLQAMAQRY